MKTMKRYNTTLFAVARVLPYLATLQILLLATPADALRQDDCVDGPTVQVRVASQMFEVPIGYRPLVIGLDRDGIYPRACSGEPKKFLTQPLEASGLHIVTHRERVVQDVHTQSIFGVRIDLFPSSVPNPVSRNSLTRIAEKILESGRQLEDLPLVGRFYGFALDGEESENYTYFIALPEGPKTPDGYPLTLWCQPPSSLEIPEGASPQTKEAVEQAQERGLLCLVKYALSQDLTLGYRFKTGRYPMDMWEELDWAVRNFVERLLVAE